MKSSITNTTPVPSTPIANNKGIHITDMLNLSLITQVHYIMVCLILIVAFEYIT
jgi:hypothetical protein